MNRNEAGAFVLALILAALPSAVAQTPPAPQTLPPVVASNAAQADAQPPSLRAQRDPSRDADARHCLDLAANTEIIACAEKYRSQKGGK